MWPLFNVEAAYQQIIWIWVLSGPDPLGSKGQAHNGQYKHQLNIQSFCKEVVSTLPIFLQNPPLH